MSRLWLPDTEALRERALEQYELQLGTDIERLMRRPWAGSNGIPSGAGVGTGTNPDACCVDTSGYVYQVTVPAMGGTCCNVFARTWTLTRVDLLTPCHWREDVSISCGGNTGARCNFLKTASGAGTIMRIWFQVGPLTGIGALYDLLYDSWDCEAASQVFPLTLAQNFTETCAWPASLTLFKL